MSSGSRYWFMESVASWQSAARASIEDKPSWLFSHYLYKDAFIALPIEFGVENLLPRTEVEFPVSDRHDDFVVNDQRFEVSVSIVLALSLIHI